MEPILPHRLSNDAVRALVELTPQLTCLATLQGEFVWVNEEFTRVLGWSEDELVNRSFLELVHDEDKAPTLEALADLDEGLAIEAFVNRYRHKDGSWRWLEWVSRVADDGLIAAAARDVTDLHQERVTVDNRMRMLLRAEEVADVGHWQVNLTDHTLTWSPQMFRIHGRDPALGPPPLSTALEYVVPAHRDRVSQSVLGAARRGESLSLAFRIQREDGTERTIQMRSQVATGPDGQASFLFGVYRDETDVVRLRRQMAQAERLASVGALATGLSQQLNDPLTYVSLNAEFLKEELSKARDNPGQPLSAEVVTLADDLLRGTRRMRRIVDSLRALSQLESDRSSAMSLGRAAAVALRTTEVEWQPVATATLTFGGDLAWLKAQEASLVQVFVNLLRNSASAIAERGRGAGTITISGGAMSPTRVWVEVRDDGVGMAPDVVERATEPFFTLREEQQTGLGLFVVANTVAALGGTLSIRSTPGSGTTVRLELPADRVDQEEERPPARCRVLVIDDEPGTRRALGWFYRDCEVVSVGSGEEALTALDGAQPFDLVLLDLMMPGMTGKALYEQLPPEVQARVVFMTGGALGWELEAFADSMGDRVLRKPLSRSTLRRLLDR